MGHNINYFTFKEGTDKNKIYEACSEVANRNGEGISSIRYIEQTCENEDKAREYIEAHDQNWYDCLAVKFKRMKKGASSKTLEALNAKYIEINKKYNELGSAPHFKDVKSEFIGCKCCGSRIAHKYLRGNYCPVCQTDMRPQTTLDKLKSMCDKREEINKKINEEKQKIMKAGHDTYWLVKIEYHS